MPRAFGHTLFIYEWSRNWIIAVHLDAEERIATMERFCNRMTFKRPMDMELGPDGCLYLIEFGTAWGNNLDSQCALNIPDRKVRVTLLHELFSLRHKCSREPTKFARNYAVSLTRVPLATKRPRMQSVADFLRVRRTSLILIPALLLGIHSARAVIFYSTGAPNYNTTAPSGALTNSGWQYEGTWGSFLGTPIAPKYFITAEHVGGAIGQTFVFRGVSYATTALYDDPDSDLRIWQICGTFPDYAQIHTNTNEVGQSCVVIGRGTQRGAPVTTIVNHGWQWGPYDGVIRWGENTISGHTDGNVLFGIVLGDLLQAAFNANGGPNECHLSTGDSGGALFIKDGPVWKLAGINYGVEGPYNTTAADPGFNAAIFDGTGLFEKNLAGTWLPANGPGSFYATRISAHVSWINSVINAGAATDAPILQFSSTAAGQYADEMNSIVDGASKTITVALPDGSRFYRLRACDSLTIKSIQAQNGNLVLRYQ